jgi:hypothetical protein
MAASRASRRAISAGMSNSGSFFSASSACNARLSSASICALSSASALRMWLVAHGLVAAGVGLELGAIHRDRAQLDQAHLARQAHHLHEQVRQLLEVEGPEVSDRAVRGEVARGQHPERHVLVQLGWRSCAS